MKNQEELVIELAKNKVQELSHWRNVRYDGGRLYYEVTRISDDLSHLATPFQIIYLDYILNAKFIIQDNLPSSAPDITEELKLWLKKKLLKVKLQTLDMENNTQEEKLLKNKIFISHSSKDQEIVKSFVYNILQLGFGISTDRIFCTSIEGQGVRSGEYIPDRLKLEIQQASLALLFISEHYKSSEICLNEVGAAWVSLEKTNVIPIMLPGVSFDRLGFLDVNRLGLKIASKSDLLQLIDDHKSQLNTNLSHAKIDSLIDDFLEKIKSVSTKKIIISNSVEKEESEWTKCYTNSLTPFHDVLREAIPQLGHGIHEITDSRVQNKIMILLSQSEFLEELWYKMADGDAYVEKIKKLSSGNWLFSGANCEIRISSMWISKEIEHQNDFILIRTEKLGPYKIQSDVGGEDYTVGILNDGTIVSNNEHSSGFAIINDDTIKLSDYDIELRNRDTEAHWIFFGSRFHKIGHNPDETIEFCKKLDSGEVEVNNIELSHFLRNLKNHPFVLAHR
ncbi:hypothetical protein SF1_38690 [Sphingobacterium faecium NBRC 15299]|uniref:toll/interleukin-1 receptor domain-containing protein n=1 Tax=Sphingobacterium faecium TaxID=34087 RepID=UPI000D394D3D|nr:toll/interleukin-1 receptor domain-containing protein [Sphingobacterium faecium]PTX07564.1 TIR domain-containing protein [Sphingobacterium faecium]GEM65887.1 hypothetical protein SF1_38690 [Sphingobacterium faecium NBRC 15299]